MNDYDRLLVVDDPGSIARFLNAPGGESQPADQRVALA